MLAYIVIIAGGLGTLIQILGIGNLTKRTRGTLIAVGILSVVVGTICAVMDRNSGQGGPIGPTIALPGSPAPQVQRADSSHFEKELQSANSAKVADARTYFKAGEGDLTQGAYADAARNFEKSAQASPTLSAYQNWGVAASLVSDLDNAMHAFKSGLALAQQRNDRQFEIQFRNAIGTCVFTRGDRESARSYFESARDLGELTGDRSGTAIAEHNLAMCQAVLGHPELAAGVLRELVYEYKSLENVQGQANALGDLGLCLLRLRNPKDALKAFLAAEDLNRQLGNQRGLATTLNNESTAYFDLGDYLAAARAAQRAEQNYREMKNKDGIAATLGNQGNIALRLGESKMPRHISSKH